MTDLEIIAQEAINNRVGDRTRYRQPVTCKVDAEINVVLDVIVDDTERFEEPQKQCQDLERKPADSERNHQNDQHFYDLNEEKKGI